MVVLAHLQRRKKLELKQINSVKKWRQKDVTMSDRTLDLTRWCSVQSSQSLADVVV
jgi:hypothetical protein